MSQEKIASAQIGGKQFMVVSGEMPGENESVRKSAKRKTSKPLINEAARTDLLGTIELLEKEFYSHWKRSTAKEGGPSEINIEVSFSFEAGINAWVVSGKGTSGLKASFKWNRGNK